eukprot:m.1617823 g.1617823  ORF g.1617823 m.1617823 type:complete len:562 (+) comp25374_c0_seq7:161-1846(+)
MDLFTAASTYVASMTTRTKGMKAMLLDKHTTTSISMVYSNSDVLANEIYLIRRLDEKRQQDDHEIFPDVAAIVFVRPCRASLQALDAELRQPRFKSYDLCFTGVVDPGDLERLAAADVKHAVVEVTEYYLDYIVVDPHLFTLNTVGCGGRDGKLWAPSKLEETARSLLSVLLAVGATSPTLRFQASSSLCQALVARTSQFLAAQDGSGGPTPTLVLVVDRRDDPITPLLNQWTYQAMVHELVGIHNGAVRLESGGSGAGESDDKHFTLSSGRDTFFAKNMYTTFGDLTTTVKALTDEYKKSKDVKLHTIADMKQFIANYPRIKEITASANKHLSLVVELKHAVDRCKLLGEDGISLLEQELLTTSDHTYAYKRVGEHLQDEQVRPMDKIRLVVLYMLKFESHKSLKVDKFVDLLLKQRMPQQLVHVISQVLGYCGKRCPGRTSNVYASAASGLYKPAAELDSDLVRHTPLLCTTLDAMARGKLSVKDFPVYGDEEGRAAPPVPRHVVVFMVGGTTYEEAKTVAYFNEAHAGRIKVLLGGTHIHNTESFFDEISTSVRNDSK